MRQRTIKWKWMLWCIVALFMACHAGSASAQEVSGNVNQIGTRYSETENGDAVVGIRVTVNGHVIVYAYDVWNYSRTTGWVFKKASLNGQYMSTQEKLVENDYINFNDKISQKREFIHAKKLTGQFLKNETFLVEIIRYQKGVEISREYECSTDAESILNKEYSMLRGSKTASGVFSYGPAGANEISCIYNFYTGFLIQENGYLNAMPEGGTITKSGSGYNLENNSYIIHALPEASRPSDCFDYEFEGWFTKKEGGEEIKLGDKIELGTKLYAHWKKSPAKFTVNCIDILKTETDSMILGSSQWQDYYGNIASGETAGSKIEEGDYYEGRIYEAATECEITEKGATVYRYFKNALKTVTCVDLVHEGPDTGTKLAVNTWTQDYGSVASCSAFGVLPKEKENVDSEEKGFDYGTYHKGYQFKNATKENVGINGCTIYRYFKPATYQIRFHSSCSSSAVMANIKDCYYGHDYTLTRNAFVNRRTVTLDPNAEGASCDTATLSVYQDFAGWSLCDNKEVAFSDGSQVKNLLEEDGTIDFYAVWSEKEIEINAVPVRMGYQFAGWNLDRTAEKGTKQFQVEQDFTVYATWKPAPVVYHVEYYKQNLDKSFELATQYTFQAYTEDFVELSDIEDIYPGFWLDEKSSTLQGTVQPDGSLILCAYFRRDEYTLSFDLNGGTSDRSDELPDRISGLFEEEVYVPDFAPKRAGYDFLGWALKEKTDKIVVYPGDTFKMTNHDQTLSAVWKPREDTKFVLIPMVEKLDGTGFIQEQSKNFIGRTEQSLSDALCEKYKKEIEDCCKDIFGEGFIVDDKKALSETYIHGDGSTALEVYLKRREYYIQICGTDGKILETQTVKYGQNYILPYQVGDIDQIQKYQSKDGEVYAPGDKICVTASKDFEVIPKSIEVQESAAPAKTENPSTTQSAAPAKTENPSTMQSAAPAKTENPSTMQSAAPAKTENPSTMQSAAPAKTENPSTTQSAAPAATTNPSNADAQLSIISTLVSSNPTPEEVAGAIANAEVVPQASLKKGETFQTNGRVYKVTSKESAKKKTVCLYRVIKNKKVINIPNAVKKGDTTYEVTEISTKAISPNQTVNKIIIGKNIKKIGKKAFCSNRKLKKIVVRSKALKTIGKNAWKGAAKGCKVSFDPVCSSKCRILVQKNHQKMMGKK